MATFIAGITGGIGLAMARWALRDDPDTEIVGLARSATQCEDVEALAAEYPGRLILVDADVTQPESVHEGLRQALPSALEVDCVIYAIGILHDAAMSPEKRLDDIRMDAMTHSYQVNTVGFLITVQALMPWLKHRHPKTIVAISAKVGSIEDDRFGGWYAYRCSKAALNMAVHNLAIEVNRRLRPTIVIALHPGTTETALSLPYQQSLAKLNVRAPDVTAAHLWPIINSLTDDHHGQFLNWDGSRLPW